MENKFGNEKLLRTALKASVPFWFLELRDKPFEYLDKRRSVCSQTIAEKGDVILFGSKTPGRAGEAFNRLAEGCAVLALITQHPFEIFDLRFHPNGNIEDLSGLQEGNQGALQPQDVPAVFEGAPDAPKVNADKKRNKKGKKNDR